MENDRYNDILGISTFVSGAFVVLALLMFCFLVWRAIVWLRDRIDVDGVAVEGQIDPLDQVIPRDPWEQAISRPAADYNWNVEQASGEAGGLGGLGGMNQREQEELLLFAGTRKQQKAIKQRRSSEQRKAMKERWKAREQAQKKQQSDS